MVALAQSKPLKASEIGQLVGITRMDAYNTLRRLQDRGLVMTTVNQVTMMVNLVMMKVNLVMMKVSPEMIMNLGGMNP